ncbi:MAG: glutaredoxin 3 [Gammaproteobacteria bacterium]
MSRETKARVVIYSTRFCSYCMRAREMLDYKGVEYEDVAVDREPARRREMELRSSRRTVPQIFIDGEHIGGFDDLHAMELDGKLDALLFPRAMAGGQTSAATGPEIDQK